MAEQKKNPGRPLKGSSRRIPFNIRMDEEIYHWLDYESKETGLSKTQIIEYAINYYQEHEKHMSKVMFDIMNNVNGNKDVIINEFEGIADNYYLSFIRIIEAEIGVNTDTLKFFEYTKYSLEEKAIVLYKVTLREWLSNYYSSSASLLRSPNDRLIYDVLKEKLLKFLKARISESLAEYIAKKGDVNVNHARDPIKSGNMDEICDIILFSEAQRLKLDNMDAFFRNIGIDSADMSIIDFYNKYPIE